MHTYMLLSNASIKASTQVVAHHMKSASGDFPDDVTFRERQKKDEENNQGTEKEIGRCSSSCAATVVDRVLSDQRAGGTAEACRLV